MWPWQTRRKEEKEKQWWRLRSRVVGGWEKQKRRRNDVWRASAQQPHTHTPPAHFRSSRPHACACVCARKRLRVPVCACLRCLCVWQSGWLARRSIDTRLCSAVNVCCACQKCLGRPIRLLCLLCDHACRQTSRQAAAEPHPANQPAQAEDSTQRQKRPALLPSPPPVSPARHRQANADETTLRAQHCTALSCILYSTHCSDLQTNDMYGAAPRKAPDRARGSVVLLCKAQKERGGGWLA